jgi:hypothetical protein
LANSRTSLHNIHEEAKSLVTRKNTKYKRAERNKIKHFVQREYTTRNRKEWHPTLTHSFFLNIIIFGIKRTKRKNNNNGNLKLPHPPTEQQ